MTTTELLLNEDSPELEYVKAWGNKFHHGFDPITLCYDETRITEVFADRYNTDKALQSFSFENFTQSIKKPKQSLNGTRTLEEQECIIDSDIKQTVEALNLDITKFWYLVIFLYDYMLGECKEGDLCNPHPIEELDKFMRAIESNTIDGYLVPRQKKPIQLSLKIEGERTISLTDNVAITYLLHLYKTRNEDKLWHTILYESFSTNIDDGECQTICIATFTKYMREFLNDIMPEITGNVKPTVPTRSSISLDKTLLISRILHFLGLVSEDEYTYNPRKLKDLIKKYKDYEPNRINEYYGLV